MKQAAEWIQIAMNGGPIGISGWRALIEDIQADARRGLENGSELDSPAFTPPELSDLTARGFKRMGRISDEGRANQRRVFEGLCETSTTTAARELWWVGNMTSDDWLDGLTGKRVRLTVEVLADLAPKEAR